ncbi:MAG: TraR/DksA family transcriptional regulator [Acidobacteriaceae bacterium]|nr:TraR/DksA family transcriptional regulator [Acidobacteriaceae bacterium]
MNGIDLAALQSALEAKCKGLHSRMLDREDIFIEAAADEFDRMQQRLTREVAISKLDRGSNLLKDVKAALNRIADGSFGTCLSCEEDIAEKRLRAVPWAAYCVGCQEQLDRKRAQNSSNRDNDADDLAA